MMTKVVAEEMAVAETATALRVRRAERDALLKRIERVLEDDPRVAAAWLFGSVGRGDADDLSDLDLRVVVADSHIAEVCAERQAYTAQVGEAILFQEAPQNRPPDGAFLLTLYEGEYGPQEVDWTWEPLSRACLWPETRVLINKGRLARQGEMPWGYQQVRLTQPLDEAVRQINSFWAMLLIIAKYAARSPQEERMGLLGMSVKPLEEVSAFLGLTPKYTMENIPPHEQPSEKVCLLREIGQQMEFLMPHVEARGGSVPWAIVPSSRRFFELVEAIASGLPFL